MSSKIKHDVKKYRSITYYSICWILMVVCFIYAIFFLGKENYKEAIPFLITICGIFISFYFNHQRKYLISHSLALFLCNALIFYSLIYYGYPQQSHTYFVLLVAASFLLFDTYHIPLINLLFLLVGHVFGYTYYLENGALNEGSRLLVGEYINFIIATVGAAYMSFRLFHDQKYHEQRKKSFVEEIRQKNFHLTKKNEQLENIIYITSHDLQEPLRNILNMAELVYRSSENYKGETKEALQYLNQSTQKMSQIITSLMTYAQIGNENKLEKVDINDLIQEVKVNLSGKVEIEDTIFNTYELPTILAYRKELFLLFQNLISNAINFRHPDRKPSIEIKAENGAAYYTFWVKDNGIGIDEKFAKKAFDLLRKSPNKTDYKGIGIGLAHCKKIVELHEGNIGVSLNETFGSTFYFTIKRLPHQQDKN